MILYYDKTMQDYFKKHKVSDRTLLLGFKHNTIDYTCEQCTHYYTYDDMEFGDTGYHALQFADRIFNFKQIYLIGYDYKVNVKSYHYDEERSDEKKLNDFKKWNIKEVVPKYEKMTFRNKIYNCDKNSDLKMFKYKKPY